MVRIVKICQNCQKLLRLSKIVKIIRNCQECWKLSKLLKIVKIVKNHQKVSTIVKIVKTLKNCQTFQNFQKLSKFQIQFMRTWWAHTFFYCVPPSYDQSQQECSGEIWAEEDPHQKLHLDSNLWHQVDLLVQRMFCRVGPCFLCSCVRLLNRSRAHVHGFKWQYVQLLGWVSSWREIVEDRRVACFRGCRRLSAWKSLACAIHPLPYCARMHFVFHRKNRDSNSLINMITYGGRKCHWCEIFHFLWSCWDGDQDLHW